MRIAIFIFCLSLAIVYGFSNVAKTITRTGKVNDFQLWAMALGIAGVITYIMELW